MNCAIASLLSCTVASATTLWKASFTAGPFEMGGPIICARVGSLVRQETGVKRGAARFLPTAGRSLTTGMPLAA
eukprot:CAMPEP_0175601220 /NCGR_PEP_ID=MMETSP0096-20121207/57997_1 /TAXON_ID=311494 /ORGANISM="Alexandrium monilatum, Strain CCMP3105" /LENGTH=73 /DNA_ID=CAMNT_0016905831 /DNA_START=32 /DNA_END=250 /DNA_ORIENTATION=+